MAGIDATIPLGVKTPDPMTSLSSLLNVAKGAQDLKTGAQNLQIGAQTLQQNQQKTQQGAIDLQERQGLQQVLADPANYTNDDGSYSPQKAQANIMRVAPTIGTKAIEGLAIAHQQATQAQRFLGQLKDENRARVGQAIYSTLDAPPEVVGKTLDTIGEQYKDIGGQEVAQNAKSHYQQVLKDQGPDAAKKFLAQTAAAVLPQNTQQTMNTPDGAPVDAGNVSYQVNTKPGVAGMPVGSVIPGTSVQKGLPPTQPTVGPNNQPGIVGPHGTPPAAGHVPVAGVQPDNDRATIFQQELAKAQDRLANPQKYMAPVDLQHDPNGDQFRARAQQDIAAIQKEMQRTGVQTAAPRANFVPTGPVPGANESKAGTVQVINDHWQKINAGAADAPVATALLSTIKQLAPAAITGTESGKRAYWNGLFNALHAGDKATGDLQKDTDLLNKSMAQLNLSTPATTDAMRTLIEAGRPHSTMSEGAIKEAAAQIEGQLKANMATRNLLAPDKRYADATGDLSHYQQKMETLQQVMDPRIFQYESMPKEDRKAFMAKLAPQDRATLIDKTKKLEALGVFQ